MSDELFDEIEEEQQAEVVDLSAAKAEKRDMAPPPTPLEVLNLFAQQRAMPYSAALLSVIPAFWAHIQQRGKDLVTLTGEELLAYVRTSKSPGHYFGYIREWILECERRGLPIAPLDFVALRKEMLAVRSAERRAQAPAPAAPSSTPSAPSAQRAAPMAAAPRIEPESPLQGAPSRKLLLPRQRVAIYVVSRGAQGVPAGSNMYLATYDLRNMGGTDGDIEEYIHTYLSPTHGPLRKGDPPVSYYCEILPERGKKVLESFVVTIAEPMIDERRIVDLDDRWRRDAHRDREAPTINERLVDTAVSALSQQADRERQRADEASHAALSGLSAMPIAPPAEDKTAGALVGLLSQLVTREPPAPARDPLLEKLADRAFAPPQQDNTLLVFLMKNLDAEKERAARAEERFLTLMAENNKPKNQFKEMAEALSAMRSLKDEIDPPTPPTTIAEAVMEIGGQLIQQGPALLDKWAKLKDVGPLPPREAAAPALQARNAVAQAPTQPAQRTKPVLPQESQQALEVLRQAQPKDDRTILNGLTGFILPLTQDPQWKAFSDRLVQGLLSARNRTNLTMLLGNTLGWVGRRDLLNDATFIPKVLDTLHARYSFLHEQFTGQSKVLDDMTAGELAEVQASPLNDDAAQEELLANGHDDEGDDSEEDESEGDEVEEATN